MIGSAILNPSIHPGAGWSNADSMIDRSDDRQRQRLLRGELLDGALAHRFGERVDVRPAERPGALTPVLDEPLGHPFLAALLGVVGDGRGTGAGMLLGGVLEEPLEEFGLPRRRLDVASRLEREVGFESPVDAVVEGALGDHALLHPGHVRGRDVDETRVATPRRARRGRGSSRRAGSSGSPRRSEDRRRPWPRSGS